MAGMVPIACSMASKQYCLTVSDGRAKFYLSSPDGPTYSFAQGRIVVADGRWHRIRGVRDAAEGTVAHTLAEAAVGGDHQLRPGERGRPGRQEA